MNARTALAKAVFWLADKLERVKTPRRTHRMIWDGRDGAPRVGDPEWVWMPCRASLWLFEVAERIDPEHFGHWGIDHVRNGGCRTTPCPDCGGLICDLGGDFGGDFGEEAA